MVSHFILFRVSFNEQRFLISKYWIHQYLSSWFVLFVLCLGNSSLLLSYKNTLLNFLLKFIILHFSDEAFVPSEDLSLPLLDSSSLLSPTNLKEYIVFYICVELSFLSFVLFCFWCGPFSKFSLNSFQYSSCSMFWFLVFGCKARGIPFPTPLHDQGSNLNSTLHSVKWSPNHWKRSMSRLYIVTLLFFSMYAEYIMRNTGLEEAQSGIKIAVRNINNLRYTDDTILMT